MSKNEKLFDAWLDSTINNDRDILKLSFSGILLLGSLVQFINLSGSSCCIALTITVMLILSVISFLLSLFVTLHKLKINADFLLEFGLGGENNKISELKNKIKLFGNISVWTFIFGICFAALLLMLLLVFKIIGWA